MLSERERQQLTEIERWLAADYPDFPRQMARRRRSFFQWAWSQMRRVGRRPIGIFLVALWLAGFTASTVANGWVGVWTYLIISAPFAVLAAPLGVAVLIERRRLRRGTP